MTWELIAMAGWRLAWFVHDFQTLIAGLIALAAAAWTVAAMGEQTRVTEKQEAARRRGQYLKTRAMLPLALSQASAYAREYVETFKSRHQRYGQGFTQPVGRVQLPSLDDTTRRDIGEMLEIEERRAVQEALSEILRIAQLMDSRGHDWLNPRIGLTVTRDNLEVQMAMAAYLHALAASLFSYARGEIDEHDPAAVERCARGSLAELDLLRPDYAGVASRFERLLRQRGDLWTSRQP